MDTRGAQALAFALFIILLWPAGRPAIAREPTIMGPISGGKYGRPAVATPINLPGYGFVEEEYFLEGKAHGYAPIGDDHSPWAVAAKPDRPYRTRILVRRPADPKKFNGTVFVTWAQCQGLGSSFIDGHFNWNHDLIFREGFASVEVASEAKCVNGADTNPLAKWDPERYSTLGIPGEDMAFDIFSQVGKLLRSQDAKRVLGATKVERIIAVGNSTSASHLITYINYVQPIAKSYDGFYMQDREHWTYDLEGTNREVIPRVRVDNAVPVIELLTWTRWLLHYPSLRADDKYYRLWEPAAAPHMNFYQGSYSAAYYKRDYNLVVDICDDVRGNSVPTQHVSQAALWQLNRWVKGGPVAPGFPRVDISGSPAQVQLDSSGNPSGGIRLPEVAVPLGRFTGGAECLGSAGSTTPFTPEQLRALYPTKGDYVDKFGAATKAAVEAGFLLPADADKSLFKAWAVRLPVNP